MQAALQESHRADIDHRSLSLVIPVYNEVEVLPTLIAELEAFRDANPGLISEVVLVDDGSRDHSAALIQELTAPLSGYRLARFSRNFGHQLAVTAGLTYVTSDAAIIMDADLQDPLEVIPQFFKAWQKGSDVVYGVRRSRDGESWFKRTSASLFYRTFRWFTDLDLPVDTGDFRLLSRPVFEAYSRVTEQQPFVRGLVSWLGFTQTGIEYDRAPRKAGTTKYSLRQMMRLASNSLTSFTNKPLRLAVRFGSAISVASLILGLVWVILAKFVYKTAISGWASLLFVIVFFGGLQLFFTGVIGTYLSKVYDEVKGRPRYVVMELWSSDSFSAEPGQVGAAADATKGAS